MMMMMMMMLKIIYELMRSVTGIPRRAAVTAFVHSFNFVRLFVCWQIHSVLGGYDVLGR